MRHPSTLCAVLTAALLLAGPVLLQPALAPAAIGATAVTVDTAAALRMINEYRASRGLRPVKLSTSLTRIAAAHSDRMASADRLDHVLPGEGSFQQRIAAGGYAADIAAENVGAGYMRLADVIAGWKASPGHNANLLLRDVTEIGIALASTPTGEFHTYWTLVLAAPATTPGGAILGPGPGFFLNLFGG